MPDEFVMIPMDALLIEQVLVNLLENSAQHADGMTAIDLKLNITNNIATFSVRDDGCGLAPDRLDKIFSSIQTPRDSGKHGMGIGLSVCATIIKAHGGKIYAENHPDGGAEFSFTLEAATDEEE